MPGAHQRLVVGDQDADHARRPPRRAGVARTLEAGARARLEVRAPPDLLQPRAACRSRPWPPPVLRRAAAVVARVQLDHAVRRADGDPQVGGGGVLDGVGDDLLAAAQQRVRAARGRSSARSGASTWTWAAGWRRPARASAWRGRRRGSSRQASTTDSTSSSSRRVSAARGLERRRAARAPGASASRFRLSAAR